MNVSQSLRLVRFPNLVIVALTQYLLQYGVLVPALDTCRVTPKLPFIHFSLLVFTTVLIAAGGYIINDIEDVEIDKHNKPLHKQIVGRVLPLSYARLLYGILVVTGLGISIYLAYYIQDWLQLIIYPVAVGFLWGYARWFKKMPLVGNLVVSAFCGFVAWVVYYAQVCGTPHYIGSPVSFVEMLGCISHILLIFGGYTVFAFVSTLFREIIKDIEDEAGDRAEGCRTLPVVLGISRSKYVAMGVGVVLIAVVFYFSYILDISLVKKIILNLTVSLPTFYTFIVLIKAKEKRDFTLASQLAKAIMLSGLIFILIMKL